jgi:hypothetical protein
LEEALSALEFIRSRAAGEWSTHGKQEWALQLSKLPIIKSMPSLSWDESPRPIDLIWKSKNKMHMIQYSSLTRICRSLFLHESEPCMDMQL